MALTPTQIADVQRTWEMCIPIADKAADIFYTKLFADNPSYRPLFPENMAEQKKKLMTMITTAVRNLHNVGEVIPAVEACGKRHVAYKVTDDMYPRVGAALLYTLEQGLGSEWTPAVRDAWTAVYETLASVMIAGSHK